jgi:predicted CoA-substrate-specific enzyme activase
MAYVLGIDLGSASSKGVLMEERKCLASFECPSGGDFKATAERVKQALFKKAGISSEDIAYAVATGYGSKQVVYADETKPEISCHGRGILHLSPSVRTAIDVGDLYSKAFKIDDKGDVLNFVLSGKCAGGSGRILQIIAKVLQVKVEEIGDFSMKAKKRVDFNTGCVVFAESEAISRISEGASKEDLLAGIHRALAAQINSLAERLGVETDLALVGGGAKDLGLIKAMEEISGFPVIVPTEPHMTAALGAAIMAVEASGMQ